MIDLSIVIVSYNAASDLERCLQSLAAAPPRASHEIVVVDNASADDSPARAERFPGVHVVRLPNNVGFAAANNVGIRATTGVHVLLLNSDTIVPAGALDALLGRLRADATVGVVGPRLVDAEGRAELSFGKMLTPFSEWRRSRLARKADRREPSAVQGIEAATRREQTPDWVSGACLLVRRADAEAVGLLDERYFMYTEDVDFCASIRRLGRRVLFVPDITIVHLRGRSAASAPAATRDAYERSHLAFYQKHHRWLTPILRVFRAFGRRP